MIPAWVARLSPIMQAYYWLWHDVCRLDYPFTAYIGAYWWAFLLAAVVALIVVGWRSRFSWRTWLVVAALFVFTLLCGHLLPGMN